MKWLIRAVAPLARAAAIEALHGLEVAGKLPPAVARPARDVLRGIRL